MDPLQRLTRIPFLRRCRVPDDVREVRDLGPEVPGRELGLSQGRIERVWDAVRGALPNGRSPGPPALHPLPGRRRAQPGPGPRARQLAGRRERRPEDPGHHRDALLSLLRLEGHHGHGGAQARREARAAPGGPGLRVHPGVRAARQAARHDPPPAGAPGRHSQSAGPRPRPGPARAPGPRGRDPVREPAARKAGALACLPRGERRLRAGRGGASRHGSGHPQRPRQGDPGAARLPLDALRRGAGRRRPRGGERGDRTAAPAAATAWASCSAGP